MPSSSHVFQDLCSRLAETIWSMRQQLKQLLGLKEKIADPQVKPNDQEMLDNITELLRKLVVETFVVEKQPPQVKVARFSLIPHSPIEPK